MCRPHLKGEIVFCLKLSWALSEPSCCPWRVGVAPSWTSENIHQCVGRGKWRRGEGRSLFKSSPVVSVSRIRDTAFVWLVQVCFLIRKSALAAAPNSSEADGPILQIRDRALLNSLEVITFSDIFKRTFTVSTLRLMYI